MAAEFVEWRESRNQLLQPHRDAVRALAFSSDGKRLVSGSYDKTLCVVQRSDGTAGRTEFLLRITTHKYPVTFAAFTADGTAVLSSAHDKGVRVWRVSDGSQRAIIDVEGALALSPDGNALAAGEIPHVGEGDARIRLLGVADGELLRTLDGHRRSVQSVAFSPDGKLLASWGTDRTLRLWSLADGKLIQARPAAGGRLAFSPDGKLLASGGLQSGTIHIWRVPELEGLYTRHSEPVSDLAFSPDGKLLALCTSPDISPAVTLELLRVSDGKRLQVLVDEAREAVSIAFSPKGDLLAAGMSDGTIRFFSRDNESDRRSP